MPYLWCLWTISNDLGVKMGVLEAKKLIGDSLTCPACVLHVPGTCHVLLMNCCISVVSCSILVILESKWWFWRPRNLLGIVSCAPCVLHVPGTCHVLLMYFCISVVSCSILEILESKWWFLRPRNLLVIVSHALHVSYTYQACVTCF